MNKQALSLAVFIAGAYPAASNALGLGDIESNSHLNQPLRAKIAVLSGVPADASQLQVKLASPDVFNRVGVARPEFLNSLQFTPTVQNGKPVILVTSNSPIQEPFVNFLLEVSWPQGQLLKEYTVMLDPPVLLKPGNTVAGEASVRAEPKSAGTGTVRRPTPAPVQNAAAPATNQQAAAPDQARPEQAAAAPRPATKAGSRTYRVKPGDTLFRVASRLPQPGVSNDQMMIALFRANPGAFLEGNMNNLRSGAILRAPATGAANALSRAEARRQIRQQNAEWRELRQSLAKNTVPQKVADANKAAAKNDNKPDTNDSKNDKARLEVLGAKTGQAINAKQAVASGGGKTSSNLSELEKQLALARESLATRQKENDELKSRVQDLTSMLDKKNRLIELRNNQLSGLQKSLSDNGIKTPPLPTTPDDKTAEQKTPDSTSTQPAANGNTPAQGGNNPATTSLTTEQAKMGAQPANGVTPSTNPAAPDSGIENHVASVNGQNTETVLRTETPPANATLPVENQTPPTPVAGQTPASMALNQETSIPLTPPQGSATPPTTTPLAPPATEPALDNKGSTPAFADSKKNTGDILELLTSPLALYIGSGALALLVLLGLLSRNKRKPEKSKLPIDDTSLDSSLGLDDVNSLEKELNKAESHPPNKTSNSLGDDPFGLAEGNAWGKNANTTSSGQTKENLAGSVETVNRLDENNDDLLTEANVYIAYGLYQQAESELKKGIERHPERLEYRQKLLECYFASNNREAFDRNAEQFAALSGYDKESLWKSIVEWGRKISPDNPLYKSNSSAPVQTTPAQTAPAATVSTSSPIKADKSEGKTATIATAATVGGAAATALATAALAEGDDDDFDFDFDDIDLPRNLAAPSSQPVAEPPAKPSNQAVPQATITEPEDDFGELALSDNDFDDLDLDRLLQEDLQATPKPATTASTTPEPLTDDDFDLSSILDDERKVAINKTSPANLMEPPDLDDNLMDFMLDDELSSLASQTAPAPKAVEPAPAKANHVANLNLHLDSNNVNRILPKDTFYAPATGEDQDWLGDIDDALSFLDFPDEEIDLHEAHISTKLDLARAYLDMGDIEGARSTLEEVMVEGNDDQRREAENLLHQTG